MQHGAGGVGGDQPISHDEKPIKPRFDSAGYDRDLVEALERDIVQTNPNIHWCITVTNFSRTGYRL